MKPHIYINSLSSISAQHTFGDTPETDTPVLPVDGKLKAIEPDYKNIITDSGLRRRMSHIVRMGVAAGLDCLSRNGLRKVDAIITATALGCLNDTEKFINSIVSNDEQLLNPTAFIQSTFNTIGSQIALIEKVHGYNVTYTHRGHSFETALLDSMMKIVEGEAANVLLGAADELTPTQYRIQERMGMWRNGVVAGEGAQFFVLSDSCSADTYATIEKLNTSQKPFSGKAIGEFIADYSIDLILSGTEQQTSDIPSVDFKEFCGEYPTASSFALWLACKLIKKEKCVLKTEHPVKTILIHNTYRDMNHSLILIKGI